MNAKGYIKGYSENGAAQALVTVGVLALVGELSRRGVIPAIGAGDGGGGGSTPWGNFGYESDSTQGGANRGSRLHHGSKAQTYREFVSENLSGYIAQGYPSKQAMKMVAEDWRNR